MVDKITNENATNLNVRFTYEINKCYYCAGITFIEWNEVITSVSKAWVLETWVKLKF